MPVKFSKCSRLLKVHVIKLFNSIQIPIIYSDSSIYSTTSQVHAKKPVQYSDERSMQHTIGGNGTM